MFNKIFLMGRLTRDPELRTTQSGISNVRFSIAVDRNYSKQGEEKTTDFFDVTAFRQTAEFVSKYFSKGRMILVEGSIQNNNYTDQQGIKHYSTAIIAERVSFCGDKSNSSGGDQNQQTQPQQQYTQQQAYTPPPPVSQAAQQKYQVPDYVTAQQQPQNAPQQFRQQVQQQYPQQQPQQTQQYVQQALPQQGTGQGWDGFEEILSDGTVPF